MKSLNFTFFKSEYWNGSGDKKGLTDEQKIYCLQELENYMAEVQGRKPRTVVNNPDLNAMGAHSPYDPDYIEINLDKNPTSFDCMDTIIHEGRHATQDDCLSGKPYNKACYTEEEIESLHRNSEKHGGIYRVPGKGYDTAADYYFQPIENDANAFAAQTMDTFSDQFRDDPEFKKYQEKRDKNRDKHSGDASLQHPHAEDNGRSITDYIDEKNKAEIAERNERLSHPGGNVILKADTAESNGESKSAFSPSPPPNENKSDDFYRLNDNSNGSSESKGDGESNGNVNSNGDGESKSDGKSEDNGEFKGNGESKDDGKSNDNVNSNDNGDEYDYYNGIY
jgi:hypothetical protein